jgi:predicted methyltransferase
MLLAGFFMHRVKGSDPMRDTEAKLATLRPVMGTVLDTATGLGYTAIAAARTTFEVTTIELDPTVLEIARRNPWSSELFERPNIRQLVGDAAALVRDMPAASVDRIIHDPPVLALSGDLYGLAFYRELARVLRPGGRLFHYVGRPDSASGAKVGRGVARRLSDAGFARVTPAPTAFGYVAEKARR